MLLTFFKIIKNVLLINKEDETIVSSLISEKLKTRTTPINAKKCIKYEKSGLTEKKAREIHDLLSQRMEKEHLFLNPELTLVELAKLMNIHPNNLSQVINTYEKKIFIIISIQKE
ncbi:hypothetical protein A9996_19130 [Gelidibacter algens]|nr:hypothetical protein A9996_19130 [Gelidibacter algens]